MYNAIDQKKRVYEHFMLELLGKCARLTRGEREQAKVTENVFSQEN